MLTNENKWKNKCCTNHYSSRMFPTSKQQKTPNQRNRSKGKKPHGCRQMFTSCWKLVQLWTLRMCVAHLRVYRVGRLQFSSAGSLEQNSLQSDDGLYRKTLGSRKSLGLAHAGLTVYCVWGGEARLQHLAAAEMSFDSWDWWDVDGRWGPAEKTTNGGQRNMHFLRRFHQTEALRNKTYIRLEQIHPLVQSRRSVIPPAVSRDWTTSTRRRLFPLARMLNLTA